MIRRKALSIKNAPRKIPVATLILYWLLLDRLHASLLVWGIVGTILVLAFLVSVFDYFIAKDIEI